MRLANNARGKKEARLGAHTSRELRATQNSLVKRAQVESFSEEIVSGVEPGDPQKE